MAVEKIVVETELTWKVKRLPSGRLVGVCDPLGLTLEAADEVELRSLAGEATHFLFLDLFEDGLLDEFMRVRGWKMKTRPQRLDPEMPITFEVPFTFDHAA